MESARLIEYTKVWISNCRPSLRWEINNHDRESKINGILGALVVVGGKTHDSDGDSLDIDGNSDKVARVIEIYDEALHNFRIATSADQLNQHGVQDKALLRLTSYNYYGVLFPKQWCNLWPVIHCDNQSLI